jgi:hypothetical protein
MDMPMTTAFALVDARRWTDIHGLGRAEAAAFVVELCQALETRHPDVDVDRLANAGRALGRGHADAAAAAAIAWLSEHPSTARLDIACLLLHGLWSPAVGGPGATDEQLASLLQARTAVTPDPSAEYAFLLALILALRGPMPTPGSPLRRRVETHLWEAAESFPDPDAKDLLLDQLDALAVDPAEG